MDYVAAQERKRKIKMICSSWPSNERMQQKRKKRSLVCGTVGAPVGSNVKITKSRVLKRMSKNDSALHKVSFMFYFALCCCPRTRIVFLIPRFLLEILTTT